MPSISPHTQMCDRYPHLAWRRVGAPDTDTVPFRCGSWRCSTCEPGKRKAVAYVLHKWAQRHDLSRFITLTLDPKKVTAQTLSRYTEEHTEEELSSIMKACRAWTWRACKKGRRLCMNYSRGSEAQQALLRGLFLQHLSYLWNKARTQIRKTYPIEYVRVAELHTDSVRPHLHLLVSQYIPKAHLQHIWETAGGGQNMKIKYVTVKQTMVLQYLMKYLTKGSPKNMSPEMWSRGARRIVTSRQISLTLTPDEYSHLQAYRGTIDGPCIGGHTPESLEGAEWEQCAACVWKRKKVCKHRAPGVVYALYDIEKGMFMTPIPSSQEHDHWLLWKTIGWRACKQASPRDLIEDVIWRDMTWRTYGNATMEENVAPFDIDPFCNVLHNTLHIERGEA